MWMISAHYGHETSEVPITGTHRGSVARDHCRANRHDRGRIARVLGGFSHDFYDQLAVRTGQSSESIALGCSATGALSLSVGRVPQLL